MTEGRVMLITGASTGIGEETARRAVEAGWRVALGARSEDTLTALVEELGDPELAVTRRCDVTGMAESLRQELRQTRENHSIRVTLIEPGMTDTPFFDQRPEKAR
jgi:NADP-dependent 3-hydroxy acid dehydrogenase YdfG